MSESNLETDGGAPRVVAAVDFSDLGEAVVEAARRIAEESGAEVELLHVAAPDPDFVGYEVGPRSVRDARAETLKEERARLRAMADALGDAGVTATPRLVEGPTVETILEHAGRPGVRMVVMGTRGRGGLAKAWMGSVCEGVLQGATCPVLVVPERVLTG